MGSYVEDGTNIPSTHEPLWRETPCRKNEALSEIAGCQIYLKYENMQPSRSFKSRGIGHLMAQAVAQAKAQAQARGHGDGDAASPPIHFFCSSGGNAGIACATAAIQLQCPATIVVPTLAPALMVSKLRTLTAHTPHGGVYQIGAHWSEADAYLRNELLAKCPGGVYVPPFDHPYIWEGASSMADEMYQQMPAGTTIDAIVCNVGGGGLFAGLAQGLRRVRVERGLAQEPTMVLVETQGADSLAQSLEKGHLVTLPAITSIATSLGAPRVAEMAFNEALRMKAKSLVVSDADAAMSAVRFADDVGAMVEVSCGASLAPIYNGQLKKILGKGLSEEEFRRKNVVVVVCGGNYVTLQIFQDYIEKYGKATTWAQS